MCFYTDDCDWIASHTEEENRTEDKDRRCLECGTKIPAGQELHRIYLQEHEDCQACEYGECVCAGDEPIEESHDCRCEKPDFGQDYEYRRCLNCDRLLQVIEDVELSRGCRSWESRPMLEQMRESLQQMDWSDAKAYFDACRVKHPEMSSWLDAMVERLWDDEERAA